MPITIVDARHGDLQEAARTGRVRSEETMQIVAAIQELRPGAAKALLPERGENVQRLRSKLAYASRIANVKIRIVNAPNRVLFTLRGGASPKGRAAAGERKRAVQQKAVQLGKGGKRAITAEDVIKALKSDGVALADVERPATMVGAVLRNMKEFERTGRNSFKYRG